MGNRVSATNQTNVRVQIGGPKRENVNGRKSNKLPTQQNRIVSTKYKLLTFIPQNLFEQLQRAANFYFFLMSILVVAIDSPVSPHAVASPYILVLLMTMVKQGYEDLKRYRSDNVVNRAKVTVIRNSVEKKIRCENIMPGELVKLSMDCDVPCDLVLLKSSDDGKCFVTTANLDGETNLKTLLVPKGLPEVEIGKLHTLGLIECEPAKTDLYEFNGRIELASNVKSLDSNDVVDPHISLNAENLLLRGSRVKNTEWAIACAVYTGQNTKLSLNSRITRNKIATSEQFINKYLGFFIVVLLSVVIGCYMMKRYYDLFHNYFDDITNFVNDFFSFFIIFYYLIPISLYISVEMHKFMGAWFLGWDIELYDPETDQPCVANMSDLNDELGQINILFSDKTGTLTKNIMIFKKCSINGKIYLQQGRGLQEPDRNYSLKIDECSKSVYTFFEALALCHTVQVAGNFEQDEELTKLNVNAEIPAIFLKSIEDLQDIESVQEVNDDEIEDVKMNGGPKPVENGILSNGLDAPPPLTPTLKRSSSRQETTREYFAEPEFTDAQIMQRQESMAHRNLLETFINVLKYHASSPDEKALVEACTRLGIIYMSDENEIYTLGHRMKRKVDKDSNEIVHFKRLQVLEFTYERRRMSVIVMDRFGEIWLYTKGAESHVLPLCNSKSLSVTEKTNDHINEFAKEGLRTLAVARRKLTKAEFIDFRKELIEANNSIADRAQKVEMCQSKLETGLDLLGATAVEDALQDNVRDTLVSLREAGIKVWVLTGDKVETALNIALSCGHIPEDAAKYFIVDCLNETQLDEHLNAFARELQTNLDQDHALLIDGGSLAIALKHSAVKFRDLTLRCHAVLCCRLSPLQKCEVVRLVKKSPSRPVTCAIGDGANDVSMIQEAHVGLGIFGREGRQAARCADYAFAKFEFLKRITLVHGHYFSQRLALLIIYFFYKNVVFMGCQLFFQMNSLYSTQSLYDSLFMMLFNVIYTTLPILVVSITDKTYTEDKLMSQPSLYKTITGNRLYNWSSFNFWMILGFYHAIIVYFFTWFVWSWNAAVYTEGRVVNFFCFGMAIMHNVVVLVNLKLVIETIYKSYIFLASIWLSIFGAMGLTFIYNLFISDFDWDLFMVYTNLLSSTFFWALSALIIVASLLPDYFFKALEALNIELPRMFPGNKSMGTRKLGSKLYDTTHL